MSQVSIPDPILLQVEKPSRYIGGEVNSVMKDPSNTPVRIAFCFPDVYEIGMSHLGLQLFYMVILIRCPMSIARGLLLPGRIWSKSCVRITSHCIHWRLLLRSVKWTLLPLLCNIGDVLHKYPEHAGSCGNPIICGRSR